ncbi:hypothetical protein SCLCIDRAFT_21915 [Scleroderma citrinum Foug A]|uniref:Uncharacterized protein n=1 Tax=Scleroderma citrinum Foug A TaxID=1036808 RepID=A0A0C3EDM3_9AGAM|nr:hypothetical protein SCLCIDRAFT_21915 [Scleroderma citrinum Foug A]
MSHVANNIDVNLHQTLDCVVAEELRSMGINEETPWVYWNQMIMELMNKYSNDVFDQIKVPMLLFHQDSEESSNFFAFLEVVWKSKSFHKIRNLEMLWSAEFKARKQSMLSDSKFHYRSTT